MLRINARRIQAPRHGAKLMDNMPTPARIASDAAYLKMKANEMVKASPYKELRPQDMRFYAIAERLETIAINLKKETDK